MRSLVSALVKDAVPLAWKHGLVQAGMGAARWVTDLIKRLTHLDGIGKAGARTGLNAPPYWLGGLFNPDAFVTATRQHVARALSCSLEELHLSLGIGLNEGVLPDILLDESMLGSCQSRPQHSAP